VFDDDFFRASSTRGEMVSEADGMEGGLPERFREPTHVSAPARVKDEEVHSLTEDVFPVEASVRLPFVGGTASAVDHAEPDELDIPAFLRRGNWWIYYYLGEATQKWDGIIVFNVVR
jgi:cell division protein FtsZ